MSHADALLVPSCRQADSLPRSLAPSTVRPPSSPRGPSHRSDSPPGHCGPVSPTPPSRDLGPGSGLPALSLPVHPHPYVPQLTPNPTGLTPGPWRTFSPVTAGGSPGFGVLPARSRAHAACGLSWIFSPRFLSVFTPLKSGCFLPHLSNIHAGRGWARRPPRSTKQFRGDRLNAEMESEGAAPPGEAALTTSARA